VPTGAPPIVVGPDGLPVGCPCRNCQPWFPLLVSYSASTVAFPWITTSVNYDPSSFLSFIYFDGVNTGTILMTPTGACGLLQGVSCFVNLIDWGYGADTFTLQSYDASTYTSVWIPPDPASYPAGFTVVVTMSPV
jgi:hypothetical protein